MIHEGVSRMYVVAEIVLFGFVRNSLNFLLKKGQNTNKESWELPAEIVKSDEKVESAAERILFDVSRQESNVLEQFRTFYKVNGAIEDPYVNIGWYSLIRNNSQLEYLVGNGQYHWCPVNDLHHLDDELKFMVSGALMRFRNISRFRPIELELLPGKFTIRMLRKLYEQLYDNTLDKGNFYKKIQSMDLLIKLDEKDKSSSKKGAFLYSINNSKYLEKLQLDPSYSTGGFVKY
jgi:ADP-ribose pyrophosphatase YjhB (NUDIX family)